MRFIRAGPIQYSIWRAKEGSTKSTAAKIARSLTDPNNVPLRN